MRRGWLIALGPCLRQPEGGWHSFCWRHWNKVHVHNNPNNGIPNRLHPLDDQPCNNRSLQSILSFLVIDPLSYPLHYPLPYQSQSRPWWYLRSMVSRRQQQRRRQQARLS
jgi:hypothetical protein